MSPASVAPYGFWRSPITSDLIVAESISLHEVLLDGDDVYWLEGRPKEAGRYVLVRRAADGSTGDVNAPPMNARTRVHEYGGGSVAITPTGVCYSHFADQRLYRQDRNTPPAALTPAPQSAEAQLRYADGIVDAQRNVWIGVREDHSDAQHRGVAAVNTIVAVDLERGGPGRVLVQGNDFYSSPRLSPDGRRLAWITWQHPQMPWDATELWIAEFADDGSLRHHRLVAGGPAESADFAESIVQPEWAPDGTLYFVSDRTNWWNIFRWTGETIEPICEMAAEFARPQWTFGNSSYAFVDARRIVAATIENGLGKLGLLDVPSGKMSPIDLPFTDYSTVRAQGERIAFRAGAPDRPPSVVVLDLGTGKHEVLRTATGVVDGQDLQRYLSRPQPVEFPTENNRTAFGLYYPPANPDYQAPDGEKPPLVVKCHGGPTSAASSTLDLRIQFWTSRGFAVLDVNYGGSTGYGRKYRCRLNDNWGVVDVDDCVNGAKYLAAQNQIDPHRAVITGGSAGGYTTLAALAFRQFFKGGASHYGVSDLEALVHDTHKFESRYLDRLIGPFPQAKATYDERSPIHHAGQISAPVIFFQGDEDMIVPVDQTERMVEALRRRGIPVGYLLFTGEQHGFRQAANIQRALDAELLFYSILVVRTGLVF